MVQTKIKNFFLSFYDTLQEIPNTLLRAFYINLVITFDTFLGTIVDKIFLYFQLPVEYNTSTIVNWLNTTYQNDNFIIQVFDITKKVIFMAFSEEFQYRLIPIILGLIIIKVLNKNNIPNKKYIVFMIIGIISSIFFGKVHGWTETYNEMLSAGMSGLAFFVSFLIWIWNRETPKYIFQAFLIIGSIHFLLNYVCIMKYYI
jgi:hypothetical protein